MWIDTCGVVDGTLEGVAVAIIDGVEKVNVVSGVNFEVECLETVAGMFRIEMVGIGAGLVVDGVDEESCGIVTEGVISMEVVGEPYFEMERGDGVAVVDRKEAMGVDAGSVIGLASEGNGLVRTDSVVGMMVENGINGEMKSGEGVASMDGM